jgi:methyl-accepting chemotaxis protein
MRLRAGASDISRASEDLSRRTETQAASLKQTAAALAEITITVDKAAKGSNQARTGVATAKADAEGSGQIMAQAVTAMSEIENSAEAISKIIGVIDTIAFQTNLLALNAGIEAESANVQASSLREVNAAIILMDQVTQQNATMVEQATAASHNLAQDTDELANLTSRFRLTAG